MDNQFKAKDIESQPEKLEPVLHVALASPRPSWSVHFGDGPRSGHVTRNALAARNNEALGLGNMLQ